MPDEKMENRNYSVNLELRANSDGRTIFGIAVPYNKEQRITSTMIEVFRKGVFSEVIKAPHRVKLLRGHGENNVLGRATLLRETDDGLYAEFKISKTREGDEALELVKDGALDQLSVGFMPIKNKKRPDGVMERLKAHLAEVSLVTFGAYGELAAITGMREGQPQLTPRLDEARKILNAIQRSK
jgi:HK97 family phage prohead protease